MCPQAGPRFVEESGERVADLGLFKDCINGCLVGLGSERSAVLGLQECLATNVQWDIHAHVILEVEGSSGIHANIQPLTPFSLAIF